MGIIKPNPFLYAGGNVPGQFADQQDYRLLVARKRKRNLLRRENPDRPLVGDFIDMRDGRRMRFSYAWGLEHGIQVSEGGSFYLDKEGFADFSGGLEPMIPYETIRRTYTTEKAQFWFFHHDFPQAHSGVHFEMDVPIWKQITCTP